MLLQLKNLKSAKIVNMVNYRKQATKKFPETAYIPPKCSHDISFSLLTMTHRMSGKQVPKTKMKIMTHWSHLKMCNKSFNRGNFEIRIETRRFIWCEDMKHKNSYKSDGA